jgi:hypothetical protein
LTYLRRYLLEKIGDQWTKEFITGHTARQDHGEKPRRGRAKLRLSRGFPR